MRSHPTKYAPGAVLVGVPFGTGIQYFEDLHRGYYTELERCRQFTPVDQFTFSSHWSFFPVDDFELGDTFVDVSDGIGKGGGGEEEVGFEADVSAIGKVTADSPLQPNPVEGEVISIDFYDVEEWERNEIGIFDPAIRKTIAVEEMQLYKEHMKTQLNQAKEWRETALSPLGKEEGGTMPPLVICASDAIPTVNQILRRMKEKKAPSRMAGDEEDDKVSNDVGLWEYDYSSGRSVPGDGRIDFDKAFPKIDVPIKKVALSSLHAKQMTWEDNGGSWGEIWNEVVMQLQSYKKIKGMGNDEIPQNASNVAIQPEKSRQDRP